MSNIKFKNFAATTIATTTLTAGATSVDVAGGTGSLFPTLAGSEYFYAVLVDAATGATREVVKVTARSTDTFTITRAQDNTSASGFIYGDKLELRATAGALETFATTETAQTFAGVQTFATDVNVGGNVVITGATKGVIFEGTTADNFETTLVAGEPTADITITMPVAASTTLAGLAIAETFTAPQRGTVTTSNTITAIDLSTTNNHISTPGAGAALTFTNLTAGQCGTIEFVNGSNYAITAGSGTKVTSTFLATISATGTYIISYYVNAAGTAVHCSTGGASA